MLALADITGLPDPTIVRFIPVLLAPSLVFSSYVFVRYSWQNRDKENHPFESRRLAAIVAIIAAMSPQIVVGVYAGILANWLALIPALFSMLLLIRTLELAKDFTGTRDNWKRLSAYSLSLFGTLSLTMLFHTYTWGYLVLVALYVLISYFVLRKSGIQKRTLLKVIAVIALVVIATVALRAPSGRRERP